MKNSEKIKLSKAVLTKRELDQLRGGGDIQNNNTVPSCVCSYDNRSLIENNNIVAGCSCTCSLPTPGENY